MIEDFEETIIPFYSKDEIKKLSPKQQLDWFWLTTIGELEAPVRRRALTQLYRELEIIKRKK